jgi:hypothetical protein
MSNPYHKANGEFASRNELSDSVDNAVAHNDVHTYLSERSVLEAPADGKAREAFFASHSNNTDDDELPTHDVLLPSSTSDSQGITSHEREHVQRKAAEAEETQQKANEQAQRVQQEQVSLSISQQEPEVEEEWQMSW